MLLSMKIGESLKLIRGYYKKDGFDLVMEQCCGAALRLPDRCDEKVVCPTH